MCIRAADGLVCLVSMASPLKLTTRDLVSNEAIESETVGGLVGAIILMVSCTVVLILRLWSRLVAARDRLW